MKRRRPLVLGLLALAGTGAAVVPIMATAVAPGTQAPNLRADPVENISQPAVYTDTEGDLGDGRLLVRFDGFVTNIGQGPLEIRGNPQLAQDPNNPAAVHQYAWAGDEGPGDEPSQNVATPQVKFEAADSHNHFHLKYAMRYSLWNQARTAQVAPGQKVGFCLYDIEHAPGPSPSPDPLVYNYGVTLFCDSGDPGATSLRMGVSAGWRDVYDRSLAYQWVDVSNTAPGSYWIGSQADPENVLWEGGGANETNPTTFASTPITVPGWNANPVNVTQTGGAQSIPLSSTKFGSPTNLQYKIISAPAHGTLNVATGGTTSASAVTYTPAPGYTGADSFSYAADSGSSPYPTTPQTASVSIAAKAAAQPSLTISGAPTALVAGTSAQLTASLSNLSGGVNWSASAGSINASGLYVAPAAPPPTGSVVVTARSAVNPAVGAAVTIPISAAPLPSAKPDVNVKLDAGTKALSRLGVTHFGPRFVVSKVATGPKGGRLVITTTIKRTVLGRCVVARIGPHKTASCKVTLKRPFPLKKVRVTAHFTDSSGRTAVRRSFVVTP